MNPAHALSLSRVLLAPAAAWALWHDRPLVSATIFTWVVVSDVLDGRTARARGMASEFGTLVDHGADAVFVTVLTAVAATLGLLPAVLPLLIAVAFLQYALDARPGAGGSFRGSRLGHFNGIAYFVIAAAALVVGHGVDPGPLRAVLTLAGWLLVLSTLVSIALRLCSAFGQRAASGP